MAGIGFELKKLYSEKGISKGLKAFFYSFLVTVGPMIMCILLITFMQNLLEDVGVGFLERQTFVAVLEYCFIFSLIISGLSNMYLSRFFADMIYQNMTGQIIKGLDTAIITSFIIGTVICLPFLFMSSLKFITMLAAYMLFMVLIQVWIYSVVITAFKNYQRIFMAYLKGTIIGIVATFVMVFMGVRNADYYLYAIVLVFAFIGTSLMYYVRSVFKEKASFSTLSIKYMDIYGKLSIVGVAICAGIYIQNMVFWVSDNGTVVEKVFKIAPFYDVPMFFAFLTIIPSMVLFIVMFESNFYGKFRKYYDNIIHGGGLHEIETSKSEMIASMYHEFSGVMELQLVFSIVFLLIGRVILPILGVTQSSVDIFSILTMGCYIYAAIYITTMLLLYFDDITGSVITTVTFFVTNFLFSYITTFLSETTYGFGFFLCTIVTFVVGFKRLSHFIKNLDYYTFCSQPILISSPNGIFTKISGFLLVLDSERRDIDTEGVQIDDI